MKRSKLGVLILTGVLSVGAAGLAGCQRDGPVEEAGEAIDEAVENAKDAINPKGPLEKAGEKIDKVIDNDNGH
jgi:hypothetical protein